MKLRRKRANTSTMWVQNESAKIDNGLEMKCELEVPNRKYFIIHYVDPTQYPLYIAIVEYVLIDEETEIDLIHIMFKGESILQLRFPSTESKVQFIESAFHPREKDSGRFSLSPTPSLEN